MGIEDALLTEAEKDEIEKDEIEKSLWYAPLPGGGTAIAGRGSHLKAVAATIAAAQHRKTWWTVVRMLEKMEKRLILAAIINMESVRVPAYLADMARAAGYEPWREHEAAE